MNDLNRMFREPSEPAEWERKELSGTRLMPREKFNRTRLWKFSWVCFVFAVSILSYVIWSKWYLMIGLLLLILPADDVWKSYAQYERNWRLANSDPPDSEEADGGPSAS